MTARAAVVVVGGGVVAAAAAYQLARRGAGVTVVEGDQRGIATNAGAGIICPWAEPVDDPWYQLCCAGAWHYRELLAMLAEDGQADTGYARVGALCVTGQAGNLPGLAALLESRRATAPGMGEVTALAPGGPARMFPPLAPGLAGLWISGAARVGGRIVAGATREEAGFQYSATVAGVGGLLAGAIDLAPGLGAAELLETRIGFRPATSDGWPVLGALADGLFVAAGHGAEGLTAGPVSGLAVAQLVLGQEPAVGLAPFSLYRFQPG